MAGLAVKYTEQAVLLGERRSLVAVIAQPSVTRGDQAPTVVVLNTGIVHRVGHHRMYVTLSRMLADRGFTVVRFDLSGIGDSLPRGDNLSPLAASMADIKEALDSIQRLQRSTRFVLIGLCAGADHAALYGHTDPRVVGLVLMDPTVPPTARYYVRYISQRLGNLRNWLSVATGRSGLLRQLTAHLGHLRKPPSDLHALTLRTLRFSPYLAECYRASATRGIQMLSVFTSLSARYAYQRQLLDAFPELSSSVVLRLEFFLASDHLFSSNEERARLFQMILHWVSGD
jgi:pimeloyl-ACP methyl ester carboxylesterase